MPDSVSRKGSASGPTAGKPSGNRFRHVHRDLSLVGRRLSTIGRSSRATLVKPEGEQSSLSYRCLEPRRPAKRHRHETDA